MIRPGLEPGTFCVLDRCDNQLRHRTVVFGLSFHVPDQTCFVLRNSGMPERLHLALRLLLPFLPC